MGKSKQHEIAEQQKYIRFHLLEVPGAGARIEFDDCRFIIESSKIRNGRFMKEDNHGLGRNRKTSNRPSSWR
jgi:hypothetical protein